jgi:hypothetical protein
MLDSDSPGPGHELAFTSFGVRIGVGAPNAELLSRIGSLLPPYASPIDRADIEHHMTIVPHGTEGFDVHYDFRDGEWIALTDLNSFLGTRVDLELGIATIEAYMHGITALNAREHVFIQGAVVALDGHALALPGLGLTGRTTLVAALVQAGADYYSDEYIVLDAEGLVHPYETPLIPGLSEPRRPPQVPLGAVAVTKYRPGATWDPQPMSQGEALLSLVSHAVPHRYEGERSMQAIKLAMQGPVVAFTGDRGEAAGVADRLLATLMDQHPAEKLG